MDTGRENIKNTGVKVGVITRYKNGYFSHALAEVVDGGKGMSKSWAQDLVLVGNLFTTTDKRKKRIKR